MEQDKDFPLIGPHEGREFELLDRGLKHVAFFCEIIPDDYHNYKAQEPYDVIEWQRTVRHRHGYDVQIPYCVIFRKTHRQQAERLYELNQLFYKGDYRPDHEYEIGDILSYPKKSVEAFVQKIKKNRKARGIVD